VNADKPAVSGGARIFAAQRYRLSTLTVPCDLIVAVTAGRKELHTPSRSLTAGQGQAVLIARGTQWDVVNDPYGQQQYEALVLGFDGMLVREFSERAQTHTTSDVTSAQVIALGEALIEALQRTLPGQQTPSTAVMRHRCLEVLLLLEEKGHCFAPPHELSWTERIQRLIGQRINADWSVSTIAQAFHMSESTLRRRLADSNITLAATVRDIRLQTALGMLQSSELSVGEVAQRCGWESHSRFTAAFQQRWGVAPSVVRARKKECAQDLADKG
jgi:AraC-like DNA-binding protein